VNKSESYKDAEALFWLLEKKSARIAELRLVAERTAVMLQNILTPNPFAPVTQKDIALQLEELLAIIGE